MQIRPFAARSSQRSLFGPILLASCRTKAVRGRERLLQLPTLLLPGPHPVASGHARQGTLVHQPRLFFYDRNAVAQVAK